MGKRTHGMAGTRLYNTWNGMWQRCTNWNDKSYDDYGGRGIVVDRRWVEFIPFMEWALANGYSSDLMIDRIDNNGPYSPENCRWVTNQENSFNRRDSMMLTAYGETKSAPLWARDPRCVVTHHTLRDRIRQGWPAEYAISTPPGRRGYKRRETTKTLTAFGETKTLVEWSEDPRCVVTRRMLHDRLRKGCPGEVALTTPPQTSGKHIKR
jgi:hypothetical protein